MSVIDDAGAQGSVRGRNSDLVTEHLVATDRLAGLRAPSIDLNGSDHLPGGAIDDDPGSCVSRCVPGDLEWEVFACGLRCDLRFWHYRLEQGSGCNEGFPSFVGCEFRSRKAVDEALDPERTGDAPGAVNQRVVEARSRD